MIGDRPEDVAAAVDGRTPQASNQIRKGANLLSLALSSKRFEGEGKYCWADVLPRVLTAFQPWAECRNPLGIL